MLSDAVGQGLPNFLARGPRQVSGTVLRARKINTLKYKI